MGITALVGPLAFSLEGGIASVAGSAWRPDIKPVSHKSLPRVTKKWHD